ncbi:MULTISPECIES: nucleotidyl transferase AbiEii/AbiGii toxin family protein [Novosphingobium]|uniref:nucleotidyl transferase AbiEii/AbiGii toxin family protein n=1 Tax=Novosphingobium TaxID=165696 RepID=UPI0011DEB99D|nr:MULTISPECIES: nucleotidyl transferase AbiEii/AbiGii toxin family protein [Novosphingobium]TYC91536.1 nucleotidyl transferase AbiEii/AbiGii toxin family protein [Novosphingobium sp. BW1]
MQQPSQWGTLFDAAVATIEKAESVIGHRFLWSFGGGTALMLQIDHRESHDVDLFLDDPQVLPFLNPITQDYTIDREPDDYEVDGARMIKLIYDDVGEIDFICCADITENSAKSTEIRGVKVKLETPAEIVGKKVFYRGASLQPRDMFDIAAVAQALGTEYVLGALQEAGADKCKTALAAAHRFDADAAYKVISRLMHRESTKDLVPSARQTTIDLLTQACDH